MPGFEADLWRDWLVQSTLDLSHSFGVAMALQQRASEPKSDHRVRRPPLQRLAEGRLCQTEVPCLPGRKSRGIDRHQDSYERSQHEINSFIPFPSRARC